jgi:hypothetical protein
MNYRDFVADTNAAKIRENIVDILRDAKNSDDELRGKYLSIAAIYADIYAVIIHESLSELTEEIERLENGGI